MKQGLIYLFTGDGKGKTSAALGTALRASLSGQKTAWISWYKSPDWDIAEKQMAEVLLNIECYFMGKGFFINKSKVKSKKSKVKQEIPPVKEGNAERSDSGEIFDTHSQQEHQRAAKLALEKALEILKSQKHFLLVCDEIINCLTDKLLNFKQIEDLILQRGKTHLVLTGRNASKELVSLCDLVSQIKKVKHPYDNGISAVKGLDF